MLIRYEYKPLPSDGWGLPPFAIHITFKTLALAFIGSWVVYLAGLVFYRLFLHPLSKFPGPFWAKISDFHAVYHAKIGDRHLNQYELHQKYGDFVRLGPNRISINRAEGIRDIYGGATTCEKSKFYAVKYTHNDEIAGIVAVRDKKRHAKQRRLLGTAFTETGIRNLEPFVLDNVKTLCRIIAEKADDRGMVEAIDISDYATWMTFDIMGALLFGKSFGMMENEENRDIPADIARETHSLLIAGSWRALEWTGLDWLLFRDIMKGSERFVKYVQAQMARRIEEGSQRLDLMHYMLNARDKETGEGLRQELLFSSTIMLTVAASDTTAAQISANLYYLTLNPSALSRLTTEIRSTFTTVDDIKLSPALDSCQYLKAVIDETLRKSPSVPGGVYRAATSDGLYTSGKYLAAGTEVVVPIWCIHHDERYYDEPFKWQPERWLKEEVGEGLVRRAQEAFNPFSIGARGCLGKRMAYAELYLTLARLLWLFDVEYVGGGNDERLPKDWQEYKLVDHFTASKQGPLVRFSRR